MNRQKSIKVRLTESEYELLKKQANGQPMASYMRSVCLGNSQTPSKNTPKIHPQLLRQLAGIGNNTNQVARQINYRIASGGELNSTDVVELERHFGEILEVGHWHNDMPCSYQCFFISKCDVFPSLHRSDRWTDSDHSDNCCDNNRTLLLCCCF